jgi:basic membrane lipoprotein Med (substrate-binding protein (PBP1-ABC) superfamily)
MKHHIRLFLMLLILIQAVGATVAQDEEPLLVFAAYATPIEEPWDGVIHTALQAVADEGRITYEYQDEIGYSGDMEIILREVAEETQPDIIFGDAFGNEEAVRRVARDYPEIAFVFGSGLGPAQPNLSVFDNWIHEPAYLSGLIAGSLTESGIVGVVGGYPVPEVNRIVNAFIQGVKEVNEDAEVRVTFINSWFDPATAQAAAQAQVDAGADVLFAERFGVIDVAVENDLWAFGNMSDQNELAPEHVITGPVWDMAPTVEFVVNQVEAGSYTGLDLKDFSMMAYGGASLAPLYEFEEMLDAELVELVRAREQEITDGLFRVNIDEDVPTGAIVPEDTTIDG